MTKLAHSHKVLLSFAFTRILKLVPYLLISIALIAIANPLAVLAEQVCQVTDPTGTPLNVRATPNGKVIKTLKNGRKVFIIKTAYDEQGRFIVC